MKKVKVLYFVDRLLLGGIQSLIIDWVSRFDKEKIQVDFLLLDDGKKYELEDTLRKLGCNVYKLKGMWITKPTDFIKYGKMLDIFFRKHHDYKIVHLHSTSKNYQVLKYAKKYGISIRISHSHSIDFQTKNKFKKLYGNALKKSLIKYSTDYFACSKLAGEWLFGKDIVKSKRFKVIHNAVDYDKFKYNEDIRELIRKQFNINNDTIVIGHVGRFTIQKNHKFLIDIFYEYQKKVSNSKLLLVGTGKLEEQIKEKVIQLGINDKVIFAGFKDNVNEIMQAIDYFVFPSLCEGLGLSLIEAQASGTSCFTSKSVVPKEVKITDILEFISLNESAEEWARIIFRTDINKKDTKTEIKKAGYFIEDAVEQLTYLYLEN